MCIMFNEICINEEMLPIYISISIYISIKVMFVYLFYGISNIVGYLMPNPFLYK